MRTCYSPAENPSVASHCAENEIQTPGCGLKGQVWSEPCPVYPSASLFPVPSTQAFPPVSHLMTRPFWLFREEQGGLLLEASHPSFSPITPFVFPEEVYQMYNGIPLFSDLSLADGEVPGASTHPGLSTGVHLGAWHSLSAASVSLTKTARGLQNISVGGSRAQEIMA